MSVPQVHCGTSYAEISKTPTSVEDLILRAYNVDNRPTSEVGLTMDLWATTPPFWVVLSFLE